MVILSLIYALGLVFANSLIFDRLGDIKGNACIFLFIFLTSFPKLFFKESIISAVVTFMVFVLLVFIEKRSCGLSYSKVVLNVALILIFSIIGDCIALGICFGLLGYEIVPAWEKAETVAPTIISNSIQIILAFVYNKYMYKNAKSENYTKDKVSLMVLVLEIESLFWLYVVVISENQGMILTSIGLQFLIEAAVIYLLIEIINDSERKHIRKQLKELERRNEEAYRHYKKTGETYKALHKLRHDFNNQLNGLRQSIAIYIFTYATVAFYIYKSYFRYILLVLFAAGFHMSAYVLLPFCFCFKITNLKKITCYLLICIGALFSFIGSYEWILEISSSYLPAFYTPYIEGDLNTSNSIVNLITKWIFIPLYFLSISVLSKDISEKDRFFFIVGIIAYSIRLFFLENFIFDRIGQSFLLVSVFPIYVYMRYLYNNKKRLFCYFICLIFLLFYCLKTVFFPKGEYLYQAIYGL